MIGSQSTLWTRNSSHSQNDPDLFWVSNWFHTCVLLIPSTMFTLTENWLKYELILIQYKMNSWCRFTSYFHAESPSSYAIHCFISYSNLPPFFRLERNLSPGNRSFTYLHYGCIMTSFCLFMCSLQHALNSRSSIFPRGSMKHQLQMPNQSFISVGKPFKISNKK